MMLQKMILLEFKGGPQMDQSILGNFTAIAETKFFIIGLYNNSETDTKSVFQGVFLLSL